MEHFIYNIIVVALIAAFVLTLLRNGASLNGYRFTGTISFQRCLIAISVCRGGRAF